MKKRTLKIIVAIIAIVAVVATTACSRMTGVSTAEPAEVPSEELIIVPNDMVTLVPTEAQTETAFISTEKPTEIPTVEFTAVPTENMIVVSPDVPATPVAIATSNPTTTAEPTVVPTAVPTVASTAETTIVPTVVPTAAPTAEPNIPHSISDLTEITIWDIERPSFFNLGNGYTYTCVDVGLGHFTKIEGLGRVLVLVGYYYYEPELDAIIPFEIEGGYFAFAVRPCSDGFHLYGRAIGEAENIIVEDPIIDGDPTVYVSTERVEIGMNGEYYDIDIAIPATYYGIDFDAQMVAESPFGYLPGQGGTWFYLDCEPTLATYYTFGNNVYTRLQCFQHEQELWIKGEFLYNASRHMMVCKEANIRIMFEDLRNFQIFAGGIAGVFGDYHQESDIWWMGANGIHVVNANAPAVTLHDFEGSPLIMW